MHKQLVYAYFFLATPQYCIVYGLSSSVTRLLPVCIAASNIISTRALHWIQSALPSLVNASTLHAASESFKAFIASCDAFGSTVAHESFSQHVRATSLQRSNVAEHAPSNSAFTWGQLLNHLSQLLCRFFLNCNQPRYFIFRF